MIASSPEIRRKNDLWKCRGDGHLAGEAHALSHRYTMHHRLAANIRLLQARSVITVRKVSDQPVAQRAATVRLPNDEMFIAKSLPFDRLAVTERMALGEHDKQTLIPERGDVAIGCVARVRQERHIKAPLSYQRNVLTRRTLDNLNGHVRMPFGIGLYQLPKKAGSHR